MLSFYHCGYTEVLMCISASSLSAFGERNKRGESNWQGAQKTVAVIQASSEDA